MIIHSVIKEENNKKQAYEIRERYFKDIKEASIDNRNMMTELNGCLKKLVARKQAILRHSILPFVDTYEKFKKIHFNESEGIEELDAFDTKLIKEEVVRYVQASEFTVSTKDFTSEEMAIILIGGIAGVPIWSTIAAAQRACERESRQKLDKARLESRQADILIKKIHSEQSITKATIFTVRKCTQVLTDLNKMFVPSQKNAAVMIEKNGVDKQKYSFDERKQLATWINLAKALKDLIDIPILTGDGLVSDVLINALEQDQKIVENSN